jgi:hypothetical protein
MIKLIDDKQKVIEQLERGLFAVSKSDVNTINKKLK